MVFWSIVYYVIEKGYYEKVIFDVVFSLKSVVVKGVVENLMFDLEFYKCYYEVIYNVFNVISFLFGGINFYFYFYVSSFNCILL